jgi:hypothetical protein
LFVFGVLAFPAIVAAVGLIWGGTALLIDAWHCRHPRGDLTDRLARFQASSLADEAEEWLKVWNQGRNW